MKFLRQYSTILGISLLIVIVVLLLSSSDMFFSSGVSFIDTDLARASGNEVYVKTKMDFGSNEHMAAFPHQIDKWDGEDYDSTKWEELLGTDVMVMRGYTKDGVYMPIWLLIMQAPTENSFHPPRVCYTSQGYKIQETTTDEIPVSDTTWAGDSNRSTIPAIRMLVTKENDDGKVTERRVVLFFYVKGNQFKTDTITMIRMEALTSTEGSYDSILNLEKEFVGQAIPLMFERSEDKAWRPIGRELADKGAIGYVGIGVLLLIPLAVLLFPRTRWGRG